MNEEREVTLMDELVASEMEYLASMGKDDDNHKEQVDIVCKMTQNIVEARKVDNADWEIGVKIEAEKENIQKKHDNEIALAELKHKHELERMERQQKHEKLMREMDIKIRQAEILQRDKAAEIEKFKAILGIAGTGATLFTLSLFELLADRRDMSDVIPRAALHIKNNPILSKLGLK